MKRVQNALRNIGIPVFAGAWKATAENTTPPHQYLVYTTQTYEDEHWDDANRRYRVYVYARRHNERADRLVAVRDVATW